MNPDVFIGLLGSPSTATAVQDMLKACGARTIPRLKRGDVDAYVEVPKRGLYFVFTDEAYQRNIKKAQIGVSPIILSNVTMYCAAADNYQPYADTLPFGLAGSDGQSAVHAKLGPPEVADDETLSDRWTLRDVWLIVTYRGNRQALHEVSLQLPDAA
ncbi:MAG TPA: hypothetical protein VMB34_24480 [Acetobacteraceae bacterium]|nr:hypothetical protein [Acetobacteraceae bacterium]